MPGLQESQLKTPCRCVLCLFRVGEPAARSSPVKLAVKRPGRRMQLGASCDSHFIHFPPELDERLTLPPRRNYGYGVRNDPWNTLGARQCQMQCGPNVWNITMTEGIACCLSSSIAIVDGRVLFIERVLEVRNDVFEHGVCTGGCSGRSL